MRSKPVEISELQQFTPLDSLKPENLQALAEKTTVDQISGGRFLFKKGDDARRAIYVVSGEVELRDGDKVVEIVEGGTPEAKNPIAPHIPRRVTARARSRVSFIAVDSELLDVMLTWDQTGSYEVSDLQEQAKEEVDWMTTLLQTQAFQRIPPANLQAIFMRLERMNYKAGDYVIKQGDDGDYFFVLVDGRCQVIRETPLSKDGIKLADLSAGATFGEEALISEAKRNATVEMLTDGAVMRLGKDDFQTLLNEPMLEWVDFEHATKIIDGGGRWLDVRLPSEFENFHQDNAVNIPLYFLRLKLKALDKKTPYVVCCDTGRRSSAASFILSERGYKVSVLRGGLTMSDAPAEAKPASA